MKLHVPDLHQTELLLLLEVTNTSSNQFIKPNFTRCQGQLKDLVRQGSFASFEKGL